MAKILVADDNSNIQKMVGLALKDQGIDVVAVGNGEAAVRKISDLHPDLVLADVFMPVRNGYEVCQYVKGDSSLSHIPVILLVGAFDPLDEQEAQRVGADGVLKKPFVPPDPLISMVKSALARAGVSLSAAQTREEPELEPLKAADILTPRPGPMPPTLGEIPAVELVGGYVPTVESEPIHDESPSGPASVTIDAGAQPVAFGSLLESPVEEQQEDPAFMQTSHAALSPERDWRSPDEEGAAEESEEEVSNTGWRPDGMDESFGEEERAAAVSDRREGSHAETRERGHGWSPQTEKRGFAEAAENETSVAATLIGGPVGDSNRQASPPEKPFSGDAWAVAISAGAEEKASAEREKAAVQTAERQTASQASAPPAAVALPEIAKESANGAEAKATEGEKTRKDSWYSAVGSPWDAEVQKANQLASTWDTPRAATQVVTENSPEVPEAAEAILKDAEKAGLPSATVEAIREEAAQITGTVTQLSASPTVAEAAAKSGSAEMEDMVGKVLAKMSPELLQAVTREILKPVVEAIVREELNPKKP